MMYANYGYSDGDLLCIACSWSVPVLIRNKSTGFPSLQKLMPKLVKHLIRLLGI